MNSIRSYLGIVAGLVLLAAGQALADEKSAMAAIVDRVQKLENWTAHFDSSTVTETAPLVLAPGPADARANAIAGYTANRSETFRFLKDRAHVHREISDEAERLAAERGERPFNPFSVHTIGPGRSEEMTRSGGVLFATIRLRQPMPMEWAYDVALGLRRLNSTTEWLRADDLRKGRVSVDQTIATLRLDDDQMTHEFRFDASLNYAMTSYRAVSGPVEIVLEVQCSDFRNISGAMVPFKVVRMTRYRDASGKVHRPWTNTITVRNFILNDPANTVETMLISWPAGIEVNDSRVKALIPVGPTSRPLTDYTIAKELANPGQRR